MKLNVNNKISGLFTGIIAGILLIIGSTVLLWWNEGDAVRNTRAVSEVEEIVVDISGDQIDSAYDGKLIALNGSLSVVSGDVADQTFGVSAATPLLSRVVEIYQWQETESTDSDNNTTYTYEKVWSADLIDSSVFHQSGHQNPTAAPYESRSFPADKVTVGAYTLSAEQIADLPAESALEIPNPTLPDGYCTMDRYLTNAENLNDPQIGNIRISWQTNNWKEASVLAVLSGDSFTTYTAKNGKTYNVVLEGQMSAEEIVAYLRAQNNFLKWFLRGVGALLLLVGYTSLFGPLTNLTSRIPVLGGLVGGAVFFACLLIALAHSLLVIAFSWLWFRPVLGLALLGVCAVFVAFLLYFIRKKKTELPQTAPAL